MNKKSGPRHTPMIKLLAVLAILASAALLGAPRAQAIDQCHAPCLSALGLCASNCLKTGGGQSCSSACQARYNSCLQNITCPPSGQLEP